MIDESGRKNTDHKIKLEFQIYLRKDMHPWPISGKQSKVSHIENLAVIEFICAE